jgi:hypothetical protein
MSAARIDALLALFRAARFKGKLPSKQKSFVHF